MKLISEDVGKQYRRVFGQVSGSRLIQAKRRHLVPPTRGYPKGCCAWCRKLIIASDTYVGIQSLDC